MDEPGDVIIAYRVGRQLRMKLVAAPSGRAWMDRTNAGFAHRCLPMRIADQAGWAILNDRPLRARWSGGTGPDAVVIEPMGSPPHAAMSHFGEGILSFSIPYLFRTPPGVSLLLRGPANMPKDGISPLEGLVETEWSVAGLSMNWQFTRPDVWVEFAGDEPVCMVVPQRLDWLERANPRIVDIERDPETQRKYQAWCESCRSFNERLRQREPEAVKLGWQRHYLRGGAPHAGSDVIAGPDVHRTRLSLREFAEDEESH